jgi:selenoprotein W-related protein
LAPPPKAIFHYSVQAVFPRGRDKPPADAYTETRIFSAPDMSTRKPRVEIEYCSQCRFILRASWMAQELLTTFADELGEVALIPGTGGIFEVRLNGERLWNKKQAGRYPEPKEIKQLIRDRIAPGKDLGHSDRKEDGQD